MKTEKGTLKKVRIGFLVTMPTRKGSADFLIPDAARWYKLEDAADGMEVDVERDTQNRIVKVTIPSKPQVAPNVLPASTARKGQATESSGRASESRFERTQKPGASQPAALKGLPKASPKVLGFAFHNPYTFLPFPATAPVRREATLLSADEAPWSTDRLTGVLNLEITTESPVLSCNPQAIDDRNGHKIYEALKIGSDVIVPATGIRGALRTLMTILTGGTLGYLDEYAYLCQGRDANLGPRGPNSPEDTPRYVFLAEVDQPGTAFKDGVVRLGQTRLVQLDALEQVNRGQRLARGPRAQTLWVGLDVQDKPVAVANQQSPHTPWKLKLSGRPVNLKGKREGVFLPGKETLTLPAELWAAYSGRNVHGDRRELKKGDLVWLEPTVPESDRIERAEDVQSLQWSRWGKRGQAMKEKIPPHILPDYDQTDGKVDEITDLFGQVAPKRVEASQFAARIRPENLVFFDVARQVEQVTLAPLMPPHPGCVAFYRQNHNVDEVSEADKLRGYKVYRVQRSDGEAPWRFEVQGVYGEQGELLRQQQNVNKTCELVPRGAKGELRIAFRGLSTRELALLLQACAVPWRLGGGKPLGLGLCTVHVKGLIDEEGEPLQVPHWSQTQEGSVLHITGWEQEVRDLQARVRMWEASQLPVDILRYPRAVDDNNFRKSRGGHAWFQRHASPRMVSNNGNREAGLNPLHIDGALKVAAEAALEPLDPTMPMLAGQMLPTFDPAQPSTDVLYGYDAIGAETQDRSRPRRRVFLQIEAFDSHRHVTGEEQSEGNQGKNAEFRREQRQSRTKGSQEIDNGEEL